MDRLAGVLGKLGHDISGDRRVVIEAEIREPHPAVGVVEKIGVKLSDSLAPRFAGDKYVEDGGADVGFLAAAGGLITEVIALRLLYAGQKDNLNMKGAFWHVLQTFVGSLVIIVAALVIRFTGFLAIDPILGMAFGGMPASGLRVDMEQLYPKFALYGVVLLVQRYARRR